MSSTAAPSPLPSSLASPLRHSAADNKSAKGPGKRSRNNNRRRRAHRMAEQAASAAATLAAAVGTPSAAAPGASDSLPLPETAAAPHAAGTTSKPRRDTSPSASVAPSPSPTPAAARPLLRPASPGLKKPGLLRRAAKAVRGKFKKGDKKGDM